MQGADDVRTTSSLPIPQGLATRLGASATVPRITQAHFSYARPWQRPVGWVIEGLLDVHRLRKICVDDRAIHLGANGFEPQFVRHPARLEPIYTQEVRELSFRYQPILQGH